MRGHSAIICVICHERVRHHGQREALEVSRKPSGTKRMICGRPRCRTRWLTEGAELRATWVENRHQAT